MMMDQSVHNNRIASPSLRDGAEKLTHVERLGQTHLLHSFDSTKHKTVYLDGTVHFRSKMRAGEHLWPDIVEKSTSCKPFKINSLHVVWPGMSLVRKPSDG
jgi:hypothetical protein